MSQRSSEPPVIAIDGPAGAGKSTVARKLAARLGYVLLDTGALYRAIALAARRAGRDWGDEPAVVEVAERVVRDRQVDLELHPDGVRVLLGGEDVSTAIREPDISLAASRVSAFAGVRAALLELQRELARRPGATGTVAEGRDMGTVVFPDAPVKFFLTASLEVRAQRRQDELKKRGVDVDFARTMEEVAQRDRQDTSRAVAPLRQADDAQRVDSTGREVEDVVNELHLAVQDALAAGRR